ncbi:threonine ammonia-lyase [Planktotalea sp.]|uniref:threonine ammonia-lyase n=1 Tax=Planktotalea sp. TaxID=2029877 RepID=UPI003D6C3401
MTQLPVSFDDVQTAQHALKGVVHRTPVLENGEVNDLLGGRLLLKAENFQRTGAFKLRGAYYRLLNLTPKQRACGVVSYSSGNHALGLARAAQMLGTSAILVMPSDASTAKMRATQKLGAQIVTFERDTQQSRDVVARTQAETSRIEVPPSAHPQVLAGAGTAALELLEDASALDTVVVPCGGGGLTAASAIVMASGAPSTKVFAAEPELFDDTKRSLVAGKPVPNPVGQRTICDAIMTPIPNDVTFPINLELLAGAVTASDQDIRAAMRFAFEHFKIVCEPGAVAGLAAILNGQIAIKDKVVATVITGGNIDAARFCALIGDKA